MQLKLGRRLGSKSNILRMMAPRKRKAAATTAGNAASTIDKTAPPLRRSSRQKPTDKAPVEQQEGKTTTAAAAAAPDESDVEPTSITKPAQNQKAQDTLDDQPAGIMSVPRSDDPIPAFTPFTLPASKGAAKAIPCLRSPWQHPRSLIFTHGAGGDLSAPAMVYFSQGFASAGPGTGMVMFPGNMNLKARAAIFDRVKQHELEQEYMKNATQEMKLAYGGRSMGARAAVVASHADEDVKMLVLASYPLVSPSGDVRDKILLEVRPDVAVLFISGDHDSMCDLDMLDEVRGKMVAKTWLVRVRGADHGMNLRGGKKLKEGTKLVGEAIGKMAAAWLTERDQEKTQIDISWDGERSEVGSSGWVASATRKLDQEKSEDAAERELPKAEEDTGNPKRKKVKR
ncbi:hypothetical protein PV04_04151 [Phialophora macrospora]|uniref:KANL3/Tex30 alpha/beta hydrolase-like domain-containing protein n=1 Tax=Phialophora macrospora TaxID=1851006 RepID=A0A0D2FNL4_9EURO|nr:hypothetical protein PV04_04151 [Phialophora macrospora]